MPISNRPPMKRLTAALLVALLLPTTLARADEGMWTFDNFPGARVKAAYGFSPSQAWLDHVRGGSLRIDGGCSASFISSRGLILTNHHCAIECIGSMSSAGHDYSADGFYAKSEADEVKCPGYEIDQLTSISNVTKAVLAATAGTTGSAFTAAVRTENAKLQKACATDASIRCDVVSLYHGGVYDVYRYNRFRDIRLVFAPEFAIAQFGGDPDNFNFPRFDLDMSFLRAYVDDKPAVTPDYLRFSKNGSRPGDVVFIAGSPGSTQRELTTSELAFLRDLTLPRRIAVSAEQRGRLEQYQQLGAEQARQSNDTLFYLENSFKVFWGQLGALSDPQFFASLQQREAALRARVSADPKLRALYGNAWNEMAAVQLKKARIINDYRYKTGTALDTVYFQYAQALVRLPAEKAKPDAERLPEFNDAALVTLPDQLFDPSPIYPGVEEITLGLSLDMMRRDLGPGDPFVKIVLQGRSPLDQAHYLVTNTKLGDVAARKALYDGGAAAIAASDDPFIVIARAIDAQARAIRTRYENEIDNPTRHISESIAKARFAVTGTSVDPDATFTPRLSYGKVVGFSDDKGTFGPYTTIAGLFDRASNADPYVLPKSWIDARSSLDPSTPMNVSTTNDITGGNSGSPLINKDAEIVGLAFDGNIHSLGGSFGYDPRLNRSISVDSRVIIESLTKVYHADRLVSEIEGK